MPRLRDGWRAYRAYTAESDAIYVREMTPVMLVGALVCAALGAWGGVAILGAGGLVGLVFMWRRRKRSDAT
jgi:hypothetical protein